MPKTRHSGVVAFARQRRRRWRCAGGALVVLAATLLVASAGRPQTPETNAGPSAVLLSVEGPIGPATARYVDTELQRAAAAEAPLVVLRLDTPGGLDTAMRSIVQAILAAPLPVVGYVAPSGARAASAGTYILYATHVAAMAPGTTLGAATPVRIGGPPSPLPSPAPSPDDASQPQRPDEAPADDGEPAPAPESALERKMVNDAVAYIRGLAELRGRNADWAESAVREAASLPAAQALEAGVIEVVADSAGELLARIDGRRVSLGDDRRVTLASAGLSLRRVAPSWQTRVLAILTNPNVAYVLMMLGIYGLIFELANPGLVLPGVVGAISLLLALYAFQTLPVSYAGLGLIGLGVGFLIGEAFVPAFGALGFGGLVALVIGSLMLMDTTAPGFTLSWPLVGVVAATTAGFFLLVLAMAVKARKRPVVSGRKYLVGRAGEVLEWSDGAGVVRVQGERWRASATRPLAPGQHVRVTAVRGLELEVAPEPQGES